MRVTGIVVEYNPLHHGHCYHLQRARKITEAEAVVAVMSGPFVQRGEPAIVDKWARAEMALEAGVDLVLELPVVYAVQSADAFAFGAMATLDALGLVDSLCFGSECGDLTPLQQAAAFLGEHMDSLQKELQQKIARGHSYPWALAEAFHHCAEKGRKADAALLRHPNNTLGIAYLLALQRLNSPIKPFTIRRIGAPYRTENLGSTAIPSATALRRIVAGKLEMGFDEERMAAIQPYLPSASYSLLLREFRAGRGPVTWEHFARPLFALLWRTQAQELTTYLHMDVGLAQRLRAFADRTVHVRELINAVQTKSYTKARVQRALTAILLGLRRDTLKTLHAADGPTYIRVLGWNERGRRLLKLAATRSRLPLITNIQRNIPAMLEWDLTAARIFSLAYAPQRTEDGRGDLRPPLVKERADR